MCSFLMRRIAARRSPHHLAELSANPPNIDTTIKRAGDRAGIAIIIGGNYSTLRNELHFRRHFAPSAGGYAAAPPQDEYATISCVPEACLRRMDSLRPEGGRFCSFHCMQSTLDRIAGSPGTPVLLQVRLLSGIFLP